MLLLLATAACCNAVEWVQSPTPIFHLLQTATETKGIISQCYLMLLTEFLEEHPIKAMAMWEGDLGPVLGDQWEEALQSVNTCSLNV